MARWRTERARKFQDQEEKIMEYQERIEKQKQELDKERQAKIEEARKERLERLKQMEKEREADNAKIEQFEEGDRGKAQQKQQEKQEEREFQEQLRKIREGEIEEEEIKEAESEPKTEEKQEEKKEETKTEFKALDNIGGHGGILFGPTPGLIQKKIFSDMPDEVSFYESLKERNLGTFSSCLIAQLLKEKEESSFLITKEPSPLMATCTSLWRILPSVRAIPRSWISRLEKPRGSLTALTKNAGRWRRKTLNLLRVRSAPE